MDFFEAMAMSGGDYCVAAGMTQGKPDKRKNKQKSVHCLWKTPEGITIPPGCLAVYDVYGKFIGFKKVDK